MKPSEHPSVFEQTCSEGIRFSLAHYEPGGMQPMHCHEFTQISFLLSGLFLERHARQEWTPVGCTFGLKPAGIPHRNHWGSHGALIFSLKLYGGELEAIEARGEPGWSPMQMQPALPELVRACLLSSSPADREAAMWELLDLRRRQRRPSGQPPVWLVRAREALLDDSDRLSIADIARTAGVHRAHFASTFRDYFGIPPSIFRRNVLTARAIAEVVRSSASLTRVAYDSGFSDQAHLSRSVRTASGLNPRLLRKLLG